MSPVRRNVPAAGALLWRRRQGALQVLLVHRAKYDDWSWPKGKLDPGETWNGAAAREVLEETGLRPRLGLPLPLSRYTLPKGDVKHVRYWAAQVAGGDGKLVNEIDKVVWLSPTLAARRLTNDRNIEQLDALVAADQMGRLDTWPLLVVRHADAIRRDRWKGEDRDRPLSHSGAARADAIVPLLDAYDVSKVVSSPAERCLATVLPYSTKAHARVRTKNGLSEEGFEADSTKVVKHVLRALDEQLPVAICTHRPLIPSVLTTLADHCEPGSRPEKTLVRLSDQGLEKGEVLVCQILEHGPRAQVVGVERLRPSVPAQ